MNASPLLRRLLSGAKLKIATGVVLAAAATAGTAFGLSQSAASAVSAESRVQTALAAKIRDFALGIAAANGDSAPKSMVMVATTRAMALTAATPGDTVPGSTGESVYLVEMTGQFVGNALSTPPGAPSPVGRFLFIVINAKSLELTDLGLTSTTPSVSLSRLGQVMNIG